MNIENGISIIIPTYKEAKNIPIVAERIAQTFSSLEKLEVLLMDDNSQDGSVELVNKLSSHYPWLKIIVRKKNKGLSKSVIDGFQHAQFPVLVVMDADLSHPPEKIPELLTILSQDHTEFAIGSRYINGGSLDNIWPISRRFTSWLAAFAARILLNTHVQDPLSGFFAVKKETLLNGDKLEGIGWKIGLEIMIKCHCRHIQEIPIHFSQRVFGKSKLSFKVMLNYLRHINQLFIYKIFLERLSKES